MPRPGRRLSERDGTGVIQASASASVTIEDGKTAALSLTLESAIDRLEVTPSSIAMTVGETAPLIVTAKNRAGEIVLTDPAKITYKITESTGAPAPPAYVESPGKVKALFSGKVTILVTETESGKSATFTVTVSNPNIPITQKSVSYQIDASHIGRAVFGQPLTFPAKPTWSTPFVGYASAPIIADGRVIAIGSVAGESGLYAFDRKTGARLWGPVATDTGGGPQHATYDVGRVLVRGFTRGDAATIQAIDAATGAVLWTFQGPPFSAEFSSCPPITKAGTLFFNCLSADQSVFTEYALNIITGKVKWTKDFSRQSGNESGPETSSPSGDRLYLSQNKQLVALIPATGAELWRRDMAPGLDPSVSYGPTHYARDYMSGVPETNASILNSDTGTTIGTYQSDRFRTPVFMVNTVIYTYKQELRAVDQRNRQTLWTVPGYTTAFSPIVIDDMLIVGQVDGSVTALDAKNGGFLWRGQAAGTPIGNINSLANFGGMAAGEGCLAVPSKDRLTVWHLAGPE